MGCLFVPDDARALRRAFHGTMPIARRTAHDPSAGTRIVPPSRTEPPVPHQPDLYRILHFPAESQISSFRRFSRCPGKVGVPHGLAQRTRTTGPLPFLRGPHPLSTSAPCAPTWDNFWDNSFRHTPAFSAMKSGRLFRNTVKLRHLAGPSPYPHPNGVQGVAGSNPAVPNAHKGMASKHLDRVTEPSLALEGVAGRATRNCVQRHSHSSGEAARHHHS